MTLKGATVALVLCMVLWIAISLVPMYPCGYWEAGYLYEEGHFAGYGYHSLAEVAGTGFFWTADSVPVLNEAFEGEGPFYAVGQWYISLLYIPMFLAALVAGMLAAERARVLWRGSEA